MELQVLWCLGWSKTWRHMLILTPGGSSVEFLNVCEDSWSSRSDISFHWWSLMLCLGSLSHLLHNSLLPQEGSLGHLQQDRQEYRHSWPTILSFISSYFSVYLVWVNRHSLARCSTPSESQGQWCNTRASSRCLGFDSGCCLGLWRINTPSQSSVCLLSGCTAVVLVQGLLLAGVVVWGTVVFVGSLSRPALACFAWLRHRNCSSVQTAFTCGTGQLWDDGGRLRCWGQGHHYYYLNLGL